LGEAAVLWPDAFAGKADRAVAVKLIRKRGVINMIVDRKATRGDRRYSTYWVAGFVLVVLAGVGLRGLPSASAQQMVAGMHAGSLGPDLLLGPPATVNGISPTDAAYTSAYEEQARCERVDVKAVGHARYGFGTWVGRAEPYRTLPLMSDRSVSEGLESGVYLSSVGGMAFDQVAKPEGRLKVNSLELKYVPNRPDGSRLMVVLNGRTCSTQGLPDWQLLPIACFADSPFFGVVTLFGELPEGQERPAGTKYVVSYHPAFEGTLLGLRLFQGDIMLLNPNTTGELPRYSGAYQLGVGERPPDPRVWRRASETLNQMLAGGERFSSYLICDAASTPTFSMRRRQLELQGTVYFYFWKRGPEQAEQIVDSDRKVHLYRSFQPEHLDTLSNTFSSQTALLEQANPAVYRSMYNTVVYAAFFRYAKEHDAEKWGQFVDSLASIPGTAFAASTPTLTIEPVAGSRR
jgi:hypothetical protein